MNDNVHPLFKTFLDKLTVEKPKTIEEAIERLAQETREDLKDCFSPSSMDRDDTKYYEGRIDAFTEIIDLMAE